MIKKLKRKFIGTAMLCVLAVFMVLLVGINVFFSQNLTSTSDSLLKALVNDNLKRTDGNMDGLEPPDDKKVPAPDLQEIKDDNHRLTFVPETRNSMRYFTVEFDNDGNVLSSDTNQILSLSEDDAIAMAKSIGKTENGKIRWYDNYRYMCSPTENGYKTVFLNCELIKYSLNSLRTYSALIAMASYALIFFIVLLVSGRVIKPISDSYDKQKRFITDAGHELKTPLTIISANNELQQLSGGENEYTKTIGDEVLIMTDLVNQLVTLSRYDEEKMQITPTQFSLSEAVIDTAGAFSSVVERAGKTLVINAEPDINYTGDEEMIRKLVSILMDNAVKYCDEKGMVEVGLKRGKHIEINVRNTYENVNSVSLEHLFDRFYREDKARTSGNGYGLGLSIASAVVSSHHGTIKARGINNNTIEFAVTL